MSDVTERFWPSLLDRLLDEPRNGRPEDDHFIDRQTLQHRIKRDILFLLNSSNLESITSLDDYANVKSSVLNYGLSALVGRWDTKSYKRALELSLREAIIRFEPRLDPNTLKVTVTSVDDTDRVNPAKPISFDIYGEIVATPVPEQLLLQTIWDVVTSEVTMNVQ